MDEHFLSNVNLPVPKQFADGGSRRSSGIPENYKISSIEELEETSIHTERNDALNLVPTGLANIEENVDNHCRDDRDDTLNQKSTTTTTSDSQSTTAPYDFSFESDTKTVKFELDANSAFERLGFKPFKKIIEQHQLQPKGESAEYVHFQPIEVYERNLYRNQQQQLLLQQQQQQDQQVGFGNGRMAEQKSSNMLQVPSICLPTLEKPPENMYFGDNITIIDTDLPVWWSYSTDSAH